MPSKKHGSYRKKRRLLGPVPWWTYRFSPQTWAPWKGAGKYQPYMHNWWWQQ